MTVHAPRPALPLFGKAMAVSLVFHLSAITLFSIVIYFPKESLRYYRLSFVEERGEPIAAAAALAESPLAARLTGQAPAAAINLPRLEFDPVGRLEIGRLNLGGTSFYEEDAEARPDTWAQFGTGIQRVRASLLELAGGDDAPLIEVPALGAGVRTEADWGAAAPRELLYAPPALFGARPRAGGEEFLLTIAADGTVLSALAVTPGASGFADEATAYLVRCRFEAGAGVATLALRAAPAGEDAP